MTFKTLGLSEELHDYVVANGSTPDPVIAELISETQSFLPHQADMQIGPEQAAFLTLLTRILGATRAVEVGTFTGLSSISIARGLAPGGTITCFDISEEYTAIARRYWRRTGLADRIDLRIGPAAQLLAELPAEPHLDLVFLDADKTGYPTYWAELVPRMRTGGVIAVDNVLRHGRVIDPSPDDPDTLAIIEFNASVLADDRVESVMLPIADGLTLARRT